MSTHTPPASSGPRASPSPRPPTRCHLVHHVPAQMRAESRRRRGAELVSQKAVAQSRRGCSAADRHGRLEPRTERRSEHSYIYIYIYMGYLEYTVGYSEYSVVTRSTHCGTRGARARRSREHTVVKRALKEFSGVLTEQQVRDQRLEPRRRQPNLQRRSFRLGAFGRVGKARDGSEIPGSFRSFESSVVRHWSAQSTPCEHPRVPRKYLPWRGPAQ